MPDLIEAKKLKDLLPYSKLDAHFEVDIFSVLFLGTHINYPRLFADLPLQVKDIASPPDL
jgi:hypothetical protein